MWSARGKTNSENPYDDKETRQGTSSPWERVTRVPVWHWLKAGCLSLRATWGLPSYGATTCRKCCKGLVHCQLSGSSDDPIPGKNLHYSNFWHSGFVLFAAGVCDLNVPRYEEFSKAVNTRSSVISGLHHSSLVKYGKTLILFGLITHIELYVNC